MRSSILAVTALSLGLLIAPSLRAENAGPAAAVRGYFAALDRQDFGRAIALTAGAAHACTSDMVSTLQTEAARNHARVEVKVTSLAVERPGAPLPGRGVPVPVHFHIDVIGHKWLFHRVARVLEGEAHFFVDPVRADRIVAIEGRIL